MMVNARIISLFLVIIFSQELASYKIFGPRDLFVLSGDHFSVCCNATRKELQSNQALVLHQGHTRLRSLLREGESYSIFDADSDLFLAEHPGYIMESEAEMRKEFCVSKKKLGASAKDDLLTFTCKLISQRGLGKLLATEVTTVRVYKLPVIIKVPKVVEVFEGNSTTVSCMASGHPDLKIVWKNSSSAGVVEMNVTNSSVDGIATLILQLGPVLEANDGEAYTCEASTSFPKGLPPAAEKTLLSVHTKPTLEIENATIYTDIGLDEDIKITIHGKPEPNIVCEFQHKNDMWKVPLLVGLRNERRIRIKKVAMDDIGVYNCTATNHYGTAILHFELTLGPSRPEVTSPNNTKYSDYYPLDWQSHSRSSLLNVTIAIETLNLNGSQATNVNSTTQMPLTTSPLRRIFVELTNATSVTHIYDGISRHHYAQHVANLSANCVHRIYLAVCNVHFCSEDLQMILSGQVTTLKPRVVFKTEAYDGTNRIEPSLLLHPPSSALAAVAWRDKFSTQTSNAPIIPHLFSTLCIISLSIYCLTK